MAVAKKENFMEEQNILTYVDNVLKNMPNDWLSLTTHRLDIYNEQLAKTQFTEQFENLFEQNNTAPEELKKLPTAFDYIRLGHPLSCVLEWTIAKLNGISAEQVISFSSQTTPLLAVLRKNLFEKKNTQIVYLDQLPDAFDAEVIQQVYGYSFEVKKIDPLDSIPEFNGTTVLVSQQNNLHKVELQSNIDFLLSTLDQYGGILLVNGEVNKNYISEIQHVRRRETIAMTPANCGEVLSFLAKKSVIESKKGVSSKEMEVGLDTIKEITKANTKALVGSSGLSIQYAIMMGLIHHAVENHEGKAIKIIVPPNCYGGTNDQARRVAACIDGVEILDLPVDGDHNMVQSIDMVLDRVAQENAIPYIIAEIPTNPRVEVPDMNALKEVLSKIRKTKEGNVAIDPVFILDQTFCPNVNFLEEGEKLSSVRTISYVSGSKFPSGGRCTAGYCVANKKAEALMNKIEQHLQLCDNEATALQVEILAQQLPSMEQRIEAAYKNTREFVNFIKATLPEAKINFVSEELAKEGFTPSVFSLDLPTKGKTHEEKEAYKRELNNKLINLMIKEIPTESKYCVSYGQLKGCYWTIPATSTQGTTKEGDKDYIVRVALSPATDLEKHKEVFSDFVKEAYF